MNNSPIANYFDVPEEFIPYLAELFADFGELGTDPGIICQWMKAICTESPIRKVLDLGCGKGAVSIPLAVELGVDVYGVDAYRPFVESARIEAAKLNVAHRCCYELGNIYDVVKVATDYDLVMYLAVGNVLGSLSEIVAQIRQTVRDGGYMLIDDGFRTSESTIQFPHHEYYVPYEETIQQLTSCGDKIVREQVYSLPYTRAMNDRYNTWLHKRAAILRQQHREFNHVLDQLLERERQECKILETQMAMAMWLLQKPKYE
ncbi:methyltransferase domain-containing protein [candidate division KSB1 bacterium]|nr:methyltransferase domain-containing protein [candidate division KSB1 bacterium]